MRSAQLEGENEVPRASRTVVNTLQQEVEGGDVVSSQKESISDGE